MAFKMRFKKKDFPFKERKSEYNEPLVKVVGDAYRSTFYPDTEIVKGVGQEILPAIGRALSKDKKEE